MSTERVDLMSNAIYTYNCPTHGWAPTGSLTCYRCQEKRMSKPRPSFVLFGGSIVGSEPVPVKVDPFAAANTIINWCPCTVVMVGSNFYKTHNCKLAKGHDGACSFPEMKWPEKPEPVAVDEYAHLRQALRDGKAIQWRCINPTAPEYWEDSSAGKNDANSYSFSSAHFEWRIKPEPEPVAAVDAGRIEWPSDTYIWNQSRDFRLGWNCAIERCKAAVERAKL